VLLAGLLLLALPFLHREAEALSCVGPIDDFDRYDLLVLGRVTGSHPLPVASPGQTGVEGGLLEKVGWTGFRRSEVTLDVDRYFRGSGPETVTFVYTWSTYRAVPFSGTGVYIGLKAGEGKHWSDECSLLIHPSTREPAERAVLERLHRTYGEGRPPVRPLRGQGLLWGAFGVLAAVVFTAYARRGTV